MVLDVGLLSGLMVSTLLWSPEVCPTLSVLGAISLAVM